MMPAEDENPPARILPLPMVGLLVGACLGGSWLMVPKKGELIERLFKDKQYERVVSVLQDELHGMRFTDMSGLQDLDTAQLTALSRLLSLTPREQLRSVFQSRNAPKYDAYVHNIVMAAIRFVDVLPPAEAHEIIIPAARRAPEHLRVGLLAALAQNAQAVSRPDLAAGALTLACHCEAADWKTAKLMVQALRWSGEPARANRELARWIEVHRAKMSADDLAHADDLHYQLALESGRPGEAFQVCVQKLEKLKPGEAIPGTLMEDAHRMALQSGNTNALLPWLGRYVDAMPEAGMPLGELHASSLKNEPRHAAYLRWARVLAQWSDWNNEFDRAFDHHLKLAALGDAASRDRCVEVYDFLGRTEECCEMLAVLGDMPDRPQLLLLYARQLAELGRDEEAQACYERWISAHPDDRRARYDYACLLEDKGDEAASRKAFESMLQAFPDDVPAKLQLATACVRDADLTTALRLYLEIPDSAYDLLTVESFLMTADALDAAEARFRALQLTLRLTEKPDTTLYLDLAEAANDLTDPSPAFEILAEGLQRLPESARLRLALADAYTKAEHPMEALQVLTQRGMKDNFEAVQRILSMAETIGDARKALDFLGDRLEARFPLSASNRLQLAVLHAGANEIEDSERLFASVPETPDTLKMLAEARQHAGNAAEGARLMTSYVHSSPRATAQDWIFLGELWEELGRKEEAQEAFDHSLVLLTSDLPGTASN